MVAGGYRAIDSLRLEKGYRVWGADITPDETPYEAGLGFCVQARQGGRVHRPRRAGGGEARRAAQAALLPRRSRTRARWRSATSRCGSDGEIVGRVTTGGYGYTVERSIAYAYLPPGAGRARHGGRGRDLRQLDREARSRTSPCSTRAASGYAARREPARGPARPYDEAYDEDGEPRPHYAALLEALADPAAWPPR